MCDYFTSDTNYPLTSVMFIDGLHSVQKKRWVMFCLMSLWVYVPTEWVECLPGGHCTWFCVSLCQLCYSNYCNANVNEIFYKLLNISAKRNKIVSMKTKLYSSVQESSVAEGMVWDCSWARQVEKHEGKTSYLESSTFSLHWKFL